MIKKFTLIIALAFLCTQFTAKSQIISTIAGTGTAGYSGDDSAATNASLYYPSNVAVDLSGNFYIADETNQRIRKVSPLGIITTVAGNGTGGYSRDGGPATAAMLNQPVGVTIDKFGNLYISDFTNFRIRKVDTFGMISTFAGNGSYGYSGDHIPATNALIAAPWCICVDTFGNVYFADWGNQRIRKVNTAGVISTVAGNGVGGFSGDGGPAIIAQLFAPQGVWVDAPGNIYIGDKGNSVIRKVNASGIISTIAGTPSVIAFAGDGGLATAASLNTPIGVTVDNFGNVYIADAFNNRIRMINSAGIINTYAGGGTTLGDGGPATAAQLNNAQGIFMDASNNLYVADGGDNRIRKISHPTVSIQKQLESGFTFSIAPNPIDDDIVSILLNDNFQHVSISLQDILGHKLKSLEIDNPGSKILLELPVMPKGIYFIVMTGDNAFHCEKIIRN